MSFDAFHTSISQLKSESVDIGGKKLSLEDLVKYKNVGTGGRLWLWIKSVCSPSSAVINKKNIQKADFLFSTQKKAYLDRFIDLQEELKALPQDKIPKKFSKDKNFLEKTNIVFQNFAKPAQGGSQVLNNWLEKCGEDGFFAHATSVNNAKKVLDEGILKPSEMILREGKRVEFELGTTAGARGLAKIASLTAEDIASLKGARLTVPERARLKQLEKDPTLIIEGKELSREFSAIKAKLYSDTLDEDAQKAEMSEEAYFHKLGKQAKEIRQNPRFKDYVELRNLQRFQKGFQFTRKDKTQLMSSLMLIIRRNPDSTYENTVQALAEKYDCTPKEILIALDEAVAPDEKIDAYLAKKYAKGFDRGLLYDARQFHLRHNKLNPEIRVSQNRVSWGYGDIVFLKKKDQNLIGIDEGSEAVLKAPWENNQKFLTLDIKNDPDLLILGPKANLEPYANQFPGKCVYIEDLNADQIERLNVPRDLIKV